MKYELDQATATYFETLTQSRTLYRIKALMTFTTTSGEIVTFSTGL